MVAGDQEGVIDGGFPVGGGVGDDGGYRGLGAGTGGGGDGYERRDGPVNLQQSLKLRHGLSGMDSFGGDGLGAIDPGAAAQGDDGSAAVFPVGFPARFHILRGGVSGGIGLEGITDAVGGESVQHGLHLSPANHAGTGDHQHIVDAFFFQECAQLPDLAGAFQIFGHPVAHEIVADFQNGLKNTAP